MPKRDVEIYMWPALHYCFFFKLSQIAGYKQVWLFFFAQKLVLFLPKLWSTKTQLFCISLFSSPFWRIHHHNTDPTPVFLENALGITIDFLNAINEKLQRTAALPKVISNGLWSSDAVIPKGRHTSFKRYSLVLFPGSSHVHVFLNSTTPRPFFFHSLPLSKKPWNDYILFKRREPLLKFLKLTDESGSLCLDNTKNNRT